jgi:hypothetical protein
VLGGETLAEPAEMVAGVSGHRARDATGAPVTGQHAPVPIVRRLRADIRAASRLRRPKGGRDDPAVRIGDRQRQRAEQRLRASYLRGELSADTYESRLGAAFAARHAEDLDAVSADLPGLLDRLWAAIRRLRPESTAPPLVVDRVAPGTCLVVGRSSAADIRILELSVSRRHAELRRLTNGWLLVDNGSTNGTFVNGVRVERAHVADGDELRLGGARVTLRTAPS